MMLLLLQQNQVLTSLVARGSGATESNFLEIFAGGGTDAPDAGKVSGARGCARRFALKEQTAVKPRAVI